MANASSLPDDIAGLKRLLTNRDDLIANVRSQLPDSAVVVTEYVDHEK